MRVPQAHSPPASNPVVMKRLNRLIKAPSPLAQNTYVRVLEAIKEVCPQTYRCLRIQNQLRNSTNINKQNMSKITIYNVILKCVSIRYMVIHNKYQRKNELF